MKRLVLVLATMLLTSSSASAEFVKTLLEVNGPVRIEVTGSAANTGNTAVTVFLLAKRFEFTTGSAAPGAAFNLSDQRISRGSRIIVDVDLPTPNFGGVTEATITVTQELGGGPSTEQLFSAAMVTSLASSSTSIDLGSDALGSERPQAATMGGQRALSSSFSLSWVCWWVRRTKFV